MSVIFLSHVLFSGVFFAPTMIVAMSLDERVVPEHRVTEGMAWLLAATLLSLFLLFNGHKEIPPWKAS